MPARNIIFCQMRWLFIFRNGLNVLSGYLIFFFVVDFTLRMEFIYTAFISAICNIKMIATQWTQKSPNKVFSSKKHNKTQQNKTKKTKEKQTN